MANPKLDIIRINNYLDQHPDASKWENTQTGTYTINAGADKHAFNALLNGLDQTRVLYSKEGEFFEYCYDGIE